MIEIEKGFSQTDKVWLKPFDLRYIFIQLKLYAIEFNRLNLATLRLCEQISQA
ncbi:hypothetical protein [Flavobacterium anhuiense]|uniref:hypothetical protein n=1 Tax=Flavobacterium anhuiense TaxID=459526 RepID=UPI00147FADF6|nr:hypothetical protein [Flavobacterium anhuiense]